LSFESSTDWSHFYAGAPEILEYWKRVADKYGVRKDVCLSHKCLQAPWDEFRAKWIVRLQRLDVEPPVMFEDECDVFITGTGLLNEWKWPSIPGLHNFTGEILHTADWQDSFTANVSLKEWRLPETSSLTFFLKRTSELL
jgi:cation diffusion facilitator CzcD-associated flavoprotein CzcO